MPACRPLSATEVERVLLSFHGPNMARDRALLTVGIYSGFRISEILSLRVRDVVQHGRITDYLTVARRQMKRKTTGRTVALHPQAQQALRTWLLALQARTTVTPDTPVFLSRKGTNQPISRRRALRLLQARFNALGMSGPLGTHSMRKTFAVAVHKQLGHDLRKTQLALGQSDINSTIKYLNVDQAEIDQAVRTLALGPSGLPPAADRPRMATFP
jgi:integrase